MIDEGLLNLGQQTTKAMLDKINGVVHLPEEIINKINQKMMY